MQLTSPIIISILKSTIGAKQCTIKLKSNLKELIMSQTRDYDPVRFKKILESVNKVTNNVAMDGHIVRRKVKYKGNRGVKNERYFAKINKERV